MPTLHPLWRKARRVCCERPTPTADYQPSLRYPWLAAHVSFLLKKKSGFFELWTCKEAYLKGKGLGLSVPLNSFAVLMNQKMLPKLVWSDIDASDPEQWLFYRPAIEPGYVTCLAVDGACPTIHSARWHVQGRSHHDARF